MAKSKLIDRLKALKHFPVSNLMAALKWNVTIEIASQRLRKAVEEGLVIKIRNDILGQKIYSPTEKLLKVWEE